MVNGGHLADCGCGRESAGKRRSIEYLKHSKSESQESDIIGGLLYAINGV